MSKVPTAGRRPLVVSTWVSTVSTVLTVSTPVSTVSFGNCTAIRETHARLPYARTLPLLRTTTAALSSLPAPCGRGTSGCWRWIAEETSSSRMKPPCLTRALHIPLRLRLQPRLPLPLSLSLSPSLRPPMPPCLSLPPVRAPIVVLRVRLVVCLRPTLRLSMVRLRLRPR